MTIENDEIIKEIRQYREAHAASFDYDIQRIVKDLQRQERESGARLFTVLLVSHYQKNNDFLIIAIYLVKKVQEVKV